MKLKEKIIHTNFLTMVSISLFYCYKKVFIPMNHCVKSVQIRSFFRFKYRKKRTRKNSVFGHFSRSEYIDNWEKFDKKSLPEKEEFYSYFKARSRRYIIVTWCIWKLFKYVSWNVWAWPFSFSFRTRVSVARSLERQN